MNNILLVSLSYSIPFAIIGIYYLFTHQIYPRLQNSRGKIKIFRFLPNGKFKTFWAKPEAETSEEEVTVVDPKTGKEIKEKRQYIGYFIKTKDEVLSFIDSVNSVYTDGKCKIAIYDSEGNQVMINELQKVIPAISPKMADSLAKRTWNAARAAAFGEKTNIMIFLIVTAGIALITLLLVFGMHHQLDALKTSVNNLASAVKSLKAAASKGLVPT